MVKKTSFTRKTVLCPSLKMRPKFERIAHGSPGVGSFLPARRLVLIDFVYGAFLGLPGQQVVMDGYNPMEGCLLSSICNTAVLTNYLLFQHMPFTFTKLSWIGIQTLHLICAGVYGA